MRAIVFSDSHISNGANLEQLTKLCNKIRYNSPDLVVLNGDIFDPWCAKWDQIVKLPTYEVISGMVKSRSAKGLPTIYIKGNHDWLIPKYILPETTKVGQYKTTIANHKYIFVHGHTFDIVWGGIGTFGFVHDIAFFIADKMPWLMIPLYNCLFRSKLPSVKKAKASGSVKLIEEKCDEGALDDAMASWNLHYATIQLRASQYAHNKKSRVVISHTHSPASFNGLMVDTGDMLDSYTYVDIVDNTVCLKSL